jgi:hypothetical protein
VQARLSITRACRIAGLLRAAYYKRPTSASERDADVIVALNAIVSRHGLGILEVLYPVAARWPVLEPIACASAVPAIWV